jgi:hypothetical protein
MEITTHELWTMLHGMGFGVLYLMLSLVGLADLWRRYWPANQAPASERDERFLHVWLTILAVLAWLTVLSGTYVIYPWYRASGPPGAMNPGAYPQRLLLASATTRGWHTLGMEWKEHAAWLVPISITMATAVFGKYRRQLRNRTELRAAVFCFVLVSFLAAGVAGFFGAMANKRAPVTGGATIRILEDQRP